MDSTLKGESKLVQRAWQLLLPLKSWNKGSSLNSLQTIIEFLLPSCSPCKMMLHNKARKQSLLTKIKLQKYVCDRNPHAQRKQPHREVPSSSVELVNTHFTKNSALLPSSPPQKEKWKRSTTQRDATDEGT